MNKEILKLVKECCNDYPRLDYNSFCFVVGESGMEAFYRAAFNAGIKAAAKTSMSASKRMDDMGCIIADRIRALKMK